MQTLNDIGQGRFRQKELKAIFADFLKSEIRITALPDSALIRTLHLIVPAMMNATLLEKGDQNSCPAQGLEKIFAAKRTASFQSVLIGVTRFVAIGGIDKIKQIGLLLYGLLLLLSGELSVIGVYHFTLLGEWVLLNILALLKMGVSTTCQETRGFLSEIFTDKVRSLDPFVASAASSLLNVFSHTLFLASVVTIRAILCLPYFFHGLKRFFGAEGKFLKQIRKLSIFVQLSCRKCLISLLNNFLMLTSPAELPTDLQPLLLAKAGKQPNSLIICAHFG